MRTTLTLDDDLIVRLREIADRKRLSFKAVVNSAIREGLQANSGKERSNKRIKIRTVSLGYRSGIDEVKLKDHLDELSLEDFASQ